MTIITVKKKRNNSDSEHKTALQSWIFIVAGLLAVVIFMFIVRFHAIKPALVSPVKSLRAE